MMKDPNVRLVASFVLGVIVGVAGFWLWQNRAIPVTDTEVLNENSAVETSSSSAIIETEAPGTPLAVQNQIIRIENQAPSFWVVVAQANLEKPTWIVIHDNDSGKPGKILGARLFDKGKTSGIVELLRATESGHSYIAVLHAYSGVKRFFDSKLDLPVLDSSGNPVVATFSVSNLKN